MFVPISLFAVSGLGMVFLILHKRLELAHGKGFIVRDLWHKLDGKVHVALQNGRKWLASINANNFFKTLHAVFTHAVRLLLIAINWIQSHLHRLHTKLKSEKPQLNGNGSASVYLKRVSEVKENGEESAIE